MSYNSTPNSKHSFGKNPSQKKLSSKGYPFLWRSIIRPFVLFLDGCRCTVCDKFSFDNHVDHVNEKKYDCRIENMKTLCAYHHGLKSKGLMKLGYRVVKSNDVGPVSQSPEFYRIFRVYHESE